MELATRLKGCIFTATNQDCGAWATTAATDGTFQVREYNNEDLVGTSANTTIKETHPNLCATTQQDGDDDDNDIAEQNKDGKWHILHGKGDTQKGKQMGEESTLQTHWAVHTDDNNTSQVKKERNHHGDNELLC